MTDAYQIAEGLAGRLRERAGGYDATATFPAEDIADLRASGLLGLLVPTALGGMGAGFADYTRVAQALARGSGATALLFNMHASVTGSLAGVGEELARQLGATDAFFTHREKVLRAATEGAMYGVAITEREAGSRLFAMRTTYAPETGGYRLCGHKAFCSGAGHLDGYLMAARAAPTSTLAGWVGGTDDEQRVSHFMVAAEHLGEVEDTWDPLGMRATASNGFTIDAIVPAEALLGGVEGLAMLVAYALPQWLVASYAAVYVGVAQAALAEAVAYVQGRTVVGRTGGLGQIGWVRARLGRADAQVEAARLVLQEAGRLVDAAPGDPETNRFVYRAKLLAGDAAMEVANSVTEACGLGALRRGEPLERLLRDARSGAVMPPSSDLAADVLGTAALGLDPVQGTDVRPW